MTNRTKDPGQIYPCTPHQWERARILAIESGVEFIGCYRMFVSSKSHGGSVIESFAVTLCAVHGVKFTRANSLVNQTNCRECAAAIRPAVQRAESRRKSNEMYPWLSDGPDKGYPQLPTMVGICPHCGNYCSPTCKGIIRGQSPCFVCSHRSSRIVPLQRDKDNGGSLWSSSGHGYITIPNVGYVKPGIGGIKRARQSGEPSHTITGTALAVAEWECSVINLTNDLAIERDLAKSMCYRGEGWTEVRKDTEDFWKIANESAKIHGVSIEAVGFPK